jgi:hypothetical protein
MKSIFQKIPLHPVFIAIYPILFLLAINISQINPEDALRPLAISISAALFITIIFGIAAKDYRQGGLTASIFLGLFFTYGHIHRALNSESHLPLLLIWALFLIIGLLGKYKIKNIDTVTANINFITLVLLIQPIITISFFIAQSGVHQKTEPLSPFDGTPTSSEKTDLPDIYYIVPDAYGRSDVVQEVFNYNNAGFIHFLEDSGFYVAQQSHSNYVQTSLSIASSMNLNYLGNLEGENIQSGDRDPLAELIHHSELRRFLEENNYQTVSFATAYEPTTIRDTDIFIPYQANLVNDLESLVLFTSLTRALGDKIPNLFSPLLCETQRGGILNIFDNFEKVSTMSGPKFVFAHIMAPHPPFVFDTEGNAAKFGDCNGLDGTSFAGSPDEYKNGYAQQIAYMDVLLEKTVRAILENAERPPVIIIQSDHGSGLYLDWDSFEQTCLRERTSILNAYYFPDGAYENLYESITPVNSFRVVLNEIFELDLALLEDQTYFSPWEKPYQVENVTERIETSCEVSE